MNKEIDWHGRPGLLQYAAKAWVGDRLVMDKASDQGAWPKPIYPEPPCGWDERDAQV